MTNAAFIGMVESGRLLWPPFQLGAWVYSMHWPTGELYRTAVPA